MRKWADLSEDEKKIITAMKSQEIGPDELIQRMRNSGRMNEEALDDLKKALDDVKDLLVH